MIDKLTEIIAAYFPRILHARILGILTPAVLSSGSPASHFTHRCIEFSLAGAPTDKLSIVPGRFVGESWLAGYCVAPLPTARVATILLFLPRPSNLAPQPNPMV